MYCLPSRIIWPLNALPHNCEIKEEWNGIGKIKNFPRWGAHKPPAIKNSLYMLRTLRSLRASSPCFKDHQAGYVLELTKETVIMSRT